MNFFQRVLWIRNNSFYLTVWGLSSLSQVQAYAEEKAGLWASLSPTVSLRAGVFEQGKDQNHEESIYPGSLWLSLKPEPIWDIHSFFEASSRIDSIDQQARSEIREAYLERSIGPLDIRIGRQVTVWGRADKLNPSDFLSSKDLRRLSSDDEDQRMGIGSVQTILNIQDSRLIAVWQYEWRRPLFPVFPSNPGVDIQTSDPEHPEQQYALKWDHAGGQVDWSLAGFSGYNRIPDFAIREVGPEGLHLELLHNRIRAIGGDVAWNAWDTGWRGECAHIQTLDRNADDPIVQNASSQCVWGGDHNVIENLNLNIQAFAKWVERDKDQTDLNPLLLTLGSQLRTNSQQRRAYQDGLTVRAHSKLWQETLELETALVWNRQDGDRTFRPKATYAWNDNLKSIIGAEIYRGTPDSFFGQLRPFSSGFFELRYSF